MAGERSAWRANDIVTFDAVCDAADLAIATVLRLADGGAIPRERATAEVSAIRRELRELDAYDRSALDASLQTLRSRASEGSR